MLSIAATAETGSGAQATPQPRLVQAAQEFEAQMMKELLKPLSSGSGLTGDDEDAGSSGAFGEFAAEALGKAISRAGGMGVARTIVHDLSLNGTTPVAAQVTGNVHANTVMRTAE